MVITSEIVCRTGTVRGQAKKNNVSIPRKTGKSTIVTHGTIRRKKVNIPIEVKLHCFQHDIRIFVMPVSTNCSTGHCCSYSVTGSKRVLVSMSKSRSSYHSFFS